MSPLSATAKALYPPDWKQISLRIRSGRAGNRCECEGECGTGHDGRCEARNGQPHPVSGSSVVLTVAHLDRDPRHNDEANLRAMCQTLPLATTTARSVARTRPGRERPGRERGGTRTSAETFRTSGGSAARARHLACDAQEFLQLRG